MKRGGFLFVGGQLALDFVNTELAMRQPPELLATEEDLADWWRAASGIHPELQPLNGPVSREAFDRTLDLRRTLRTELLHAVESGAFSDAFLDEVNDVIAGGRPQLRRSQNGAFVDIIAVRAEDQIPLAIAMAASQLVTEAHIERVHACKNDRCSVMFLDRTKSNTRRFCSTLCFDQVRARERRRRA